MLLFSLCLVFSRSLCWCFFFFFFFNDTATTEIYTLSLHDALPIRAIKELAGEVGKPRWPWEAPRSEEHTSELQSRSDLVCRLLLEKKKRDHIRRKHNNKKTTTETSKQHKKEE